MNTIFSPQLQQVSEVCQIRSPAASYYFSNLIDLVTEKFSYHQEMSKVEELSRVLKDTQQRLNAASSGLYLEIQHVSFCFQ